MTHFSTAYLMEGSYKTKAHAFRRDDNGSRVNLPTPAIEVVS